MKTGKEQLYHLKGKILKLQEVPCNIRLELTNDIYKIEQALNIPSVGDPVCRNEVNKCPKYMQDVNGEKECKGCEYYC